MPDGTQVLVGQGNGSDVLVISTDGSRAYVACRTCKTVTVLER